MTPKGSRQASPAAVALVLVCLTAPFSRGDKVFLTNGQSIEGTVIEESTGEVKMRLPLGLTMGIPRAQIVRVEIEVPPTPTPAPPRAEGTGVSIRILEKPKPGGPPEPQPTPGGPGTGAMAQPVDLRAVVGETVPLPAAEPKGEPVGTCGKIMGQVQVREADGTWRDLKEGEVIYKGQVFRSLQGRARLVLTDGTEIGITENSEGRVRNEPGSRFELFRGRIWSQIREYSSAGEVKLQIQSPNAVAAVRGGLVRFEVTPQRIARVTLFEGFADVEERGGAPSRLAPLQVAVFEPDGSLTGFEAAAPEERREWDEWDQWAADIIRDTRHLGFGVGGAVIGDMARQIASEQKLYKQMMDDANRQVMLNKEAEKLETYAEAVRRFHGDVGYMPPEEKAWERLKYNLGDQGWKGPYLDAEATLPLKDRWGNEIRYLLRTSRAGTRYAEIISNGPDGVFDDGKSDADLKVIVHIPQ